MSQIHKTILSQFTINDNCVQITINEDASFDLDLVQTHFKEVYEVIKTPYPKSLIDFTKTKFAAFPRESMEYMANNEYTCNSTHLAIVINGLAQKILGNFYLKFFKPKRKTKIFTNKKEARLWLNSVHFENFENRIVSQSIN